MGDALSSAELAVLAAALGSDASPWIDDSDLLGLDRPILGLRLEAAREGLILRELADAQPDGSLRVRAPMDGLLRDALVAPVGFELQHARAGGTPERAQFGLAGGGAVAHRWLSGDAHTFYRLENVSNIEAEVLNLAAPPEGRTSREYEVPQAVMAALARTPPEPEGRLRALLNEAGVEPGDAEALLRAGLAPAQQTVFWSIGLRGNQVQARALLWFSDAATSWLITNFDASGNVVVGPATRADIQRSIAAVISAASAA